MIRAFIETSLIDWDGMITSVLFFDRCNFRCPFCQNWRLITNPERFPEYNFDDIIGRVSGKKNWIDGIVLTGGEPLVYFETVIEIAKKVKEKNIGLKLDTNGSFPDRLESLINSALVDYVAMDIKAPLNDEYFKAIGKRSNPEILEMIKKSVKILTGSIVDYEFRTTCVPGLIDEESIKKIGEAIKGAKRWALQRFIPFNAYKKEYRNKTYDEKKLNEFFKIACQFVKEVRLR